MSTGEVRQEATSFGAEGSAAPMRLGRDGSPITRDFITQLALEASCL